MTAFPQALIIECAYLEFVQFGCDDVASRGMQDDASLGQRQTAQRERLSPIARISSSVSSGVANWRGDTMSTLDIGIAIGAVVVIAGLLLRSTWHRAVIKECLLHPRSDGWLDIEEGQVVVHRGASLADHVLSQTVASLEQAQSALKAASLELSARSTTPSTTESQNRESSSWYAAIAASVAAVAAGAAAYLLRGDSSGNGGGA